MVISGKSQNTTKRVPGGGMTSAITKKENENLWLSLPKKIFLKNPEKNRKKEKNKNTALNIKSIT